MAVMTERIRVHLVRYGIAVEAADRPARKQPVRRVMVISVGLIFAGMGMVVLAVLNMLPVSFLTAFLGFAFTLAGGTMTLIFSGEI